ncbi:MAG: lactonase family protein [Terriglobia bacterium]
MSTEIDGGISNSASRRDFLKGAAALAAGGQALAARGQTMRPARKARIRAYVGTYSAAKGPEPGTRANGKGIYVFEMDAASGELTQVDIAETKDSPSWLDFHPDGKHLYSANEVHNFEGSSGSVSAYGIDSATGRLRPLNTVSSEGAGPAHLSVHPSGRYVLVANYAGGTIAVLPIRPSGELGAATDVKHDHGARGKPRATDAPAGSFAISGHDDGPHAHMIRSDPKGRFVLHTDLALDRIFSWKLDLESGKLEPNDPHATPLPSGDGPRHFAFHPTGRWLYCLQEEASTIALFDYDAERGTLAHRHTVSSLPHGFAGTSFASEIRISSDGRFLYAGNRVHDSIAWFSIEGDGALSFGGEEWTRGDYPRSFNFDPSERFVYCCNQRADAVTLFRRDARSGRLAFTGRYFGIGTPAAIVFALAKAP